MILRMRAVAGGAMIGQRLGTDPVGADAGRRTERAAERWEATMDGSRFDGLVKTLTVRPGSRRGLFRIVATGLLGAGLGGLGFGVRAAACKPKGLPCNAGKPCCSGLCKGPTGRKTCRPATGQGTCTILKDTCEVGGQAAFCGPAGAGCSCFIRPNGAAFCANTSSFDCLPCAKCPAGTVCVKARNGLCVACPVGTGPTTTICVRPCGAPSE